MKWSNWLTRIKHHEKHARDSSRKNASRHSFRLCHAFAGRAAPGRFHLFAFIRRRHHAMFHHRAISAVAHRPIAILGFHRLGERSPNGVQTSELTPQPVSLCSSTEERVRVRSRIKPVLASLSSSTEERV